MAVFCKPFLNEFTEYIYKEVKEKIDITFEEYKDGHYYFWSPRKKRMIYIFGKKMFYFPSHITILTLYSQTDPSKCYDKQILINSLGLQYMAAYKLIKNHWCYVLNGDKFTAIKCCEADITLPIPEVDDFIKDLLPVWITGHSDLPKLTKLLRTYKKRFKFRNKNYSRACFPSDFISSIL